MRPWVGGACSWGSVHQGEVGHLVVNIVEVVRLLRAPSVHVSGKFAALGWVDGDWRSVVTRTVAWHVDSLVHRRIRASVPGPSHCTSQSSENQIFTMGFRVVSGQPIDLLQ